MLAYGPLTDAHSYLRDPWCQLDFCVVSLAWWPILTHTSAVNVNVLRSVRALRPLKFVRFIDGMPVLVNTILGVVPKMGNVGMLCGFLVLVCGLRSACI